MSARDTATADSLVSSAATETAAAVRWRQRLRRLHGVAAVARWHDQSCRPGSPSPRPIGLHREGGRGGLRTRREARGEQLPFSACPAALHFVPAGRSPRGGSPAGRAWRSWGGVT